MRRVLDEEIARLEPLHLHYEPIKDIMEECIAKLEKRLIDLESGKFNYDIKE